MPKRERERFQKAYIKDRQRQKLSKWYRSYSPSAAYVPHQKATRTFEVLPCQPEPHESIIQRQILIRVDGAYNPPIKKGMMRYGFPKVVPDNFHRKTRDCSCRTHVHAVRKVLEQEAFGDDYEYICGRKVHKYPFGLADK